MTTLTFASWAQPAAGAAEADVDPVDTTIDNPPDPPPRPGLDPVAQVTDAVNADTRNPAGPHIEMLGPEGIIGLLPGQIINRFPAPGSTGSEAINLAAVEFNTSDLPWRFSPARAGTANRLRPWLVLVVAPADIALISGTPLPTMTIPVRYLPDLAESWAWAHVQADGSIPTVGRSRLLCPLKLPPDTTLRAAVVPAFRGGVQAGLGQRVDAATPHAPAWTLDQPADAVLPVYDSWQFATGKDADFEFLARRIRPAHREDLGSFGYRPIDINDAWIGDPITPGGSAVITLGGALRPLGAPPPQQATTDQLAAFVTRIAGDVAATAAGALGPPLRGGQHVQRATITTSGGDWVDEVNRDPAHRMTAARGADWVMANRETLMAQAWSQAGQIREAGKHLARCRAAAAIATSLQSRHLDTLTTDEFVTVTAPAAARARLGAATDQPTLSAAVAATVAPTGLHTTALARLIRPAGAVGRATGAAAMLTRAIAGALNATSTTGYSVSTLAAVAHPTPSPAGDTNPVADRVAAENTATAADAATSLWVASRVAAAQGATIATTFTTKLAPTDFLNGPSSVATQLSSATVRSALALAITQDQLTVNELTNPPAAPTIAIHPDGLQIAPPAVDTLVRASVNSSAAVGRRLASAVVRGGAPVTDLDPILPTPDVPIPMASAMIDRDPEWFLPGIGRFPLDRANLLTSDSVFVESVLLGANVQLLAEFLWREFPTDRRGTPIARFWPRPDGSTDITPIYQWAGALGTHMRPDETGAIVILIRAELFRRYPATVVLAARAEVDPDHPGRLRPAGTLDNWMTPLFTLQIDAVTRAIAFAVPLEEVQAPVTPAAPGWFFVMIEPPTSMHFGFKLRTDPPSADPAPPAPATWNDLTWDHVIDARGFASARKPVSVNPPQPPPAPQWGGAQACAGDVARIALQRPVRVALHASTMIPTGG